jgi:hypothetical protein
MVKGRAFAGGRWVGRQWRLLQGQLQDPLEPCHVHEVHRQRRFTGGIQTRGSVRLGEAQQLLALAYFGPREVAAEQPLGEQPRELTECGCFSDHAIGCPQRIGGAFSRIVVGIGHACSFQLTWVSLDQRATVIEAHELTVGAQLQLGARRARRRDVAGEQSLFYGDGWHTSRMQRGQAKSLLPLPTRQVIARDAQWDGWLARLDAWTARWTLISSGIFPPQNALPSTFI